MNELFSLIVCFFFLNISFNQSIKIQEKYGGETIEKSANYNADPTGMRTGNPPEGTLPDTLQRTAQDLEEYVDKV